MDYDQIRQCASNCRFTYHARHEMEDEPLGLIRVDEVLTATIPQLPDSWPDPRGTAAARRLRPGSSGGEADNHYDLPAGPGTVGSGIPATESPMKCVICKNGEVRGGQSPGRNQDWV